VAQYRYLVGDLETGVLRDEMPFSGVTYSQVLNAPGTFQATIGLRHQKATRANLDPGRTVIYVERDGVLLWGGILWAASGNADDGKITVRGEGFWSYFRRRVLRATKTYTATDQFAIAQDLINWAQSEPGGSINVAVGTETSGVARDRTYNNWERKNIGEAVEQLAAVEGGFDFAIDVDYDSGGSIIRTFRPEYPRRGRDTSIVFELGTNVGGFSQLVDATVQANNIDVIGAGDGSSMLIATVTDLTAVPPYPLLDDVLSYKDVTLVDTLEGHGNAALAARATPLETIPTIAQFGPDTGLGSYIAGDEVTVRGDAGFIDVDQRARIIEISVKVDEQSSEQIDIALQPAEGFV
jgi:ReqiPepy6 Gp37-like protein